MKNNKYLTIYSILVSVIFITTIACFGINLYREYSGGYVRTQKTFSEMSLAVQNTLQTTNEYSTDFQTKIEAAVGTLDDYAALEILKNGTPIFSYLPRASIPSDSTNMIKLYYNNLKAGDNGIYITAAMYTLRPIEIVKHAKISFVIILIFTAITVLIIIYLNVFAKNVSTTELIIEEPSDTKADKDENIIESDDEMPEIEKSEDETQEETSDDDYNNENDDITENNDEEDSNNIDENIESEQEAEAEKLEEESPQSSNNENEEIPPVEESAIGINSENDGEFESYDIPVIEGDFSDDNDSEESASTTEIDEQEHESESPEDAAEENDANENEVPPEEKAELPINDEKPAKIEDTSPQGLFSPETGFGWESYLLTRLDNELVRASSLEFDLILFLIRIKNIDRKSEAIRDISTLLVNSFQFKDLIFEYKDDCFAAIKTNCSIDDAIPLADKLHNEISSVISEADGKCYIGMTSRTIRIVSAARLLKEADSALAHAQEDEDSPIIAFRANAEKYLEFVDKKDR